MAPSLYCPVISRVAPLFYCSFALLLFCLLRIAYRKLPKYLDIILRTGSLIEYVALKKTRSQSRSGSPSQSSLNSERALDCMPSMDGCLGLELAAHYNTSRFRMVIATAVQLVGCRESCPRSVGEAAHMLGQSICCKAV
jgi:hypothetical protein